MLKAKKQIVRREVEKDDIIESFNRARSFYDLNKKNIGYGVIVLIALIAGAYFYFNNKSNNNQLAATALGKVFGIYDAGSTDVNQYKVAINGQPERAVKGLKDIVELYGGTESGELARFYLANAHFNLGEYDEALKNFESFSGGDKLIQASAVAGAAACFDAKGKHAEAASSYEKAANMVSSDLNSPDYLASAGRCYQKAGEKEKALSVFQRLKKDYPTSPAARDADRYISQLSA